MVKINAYIKENTVYRVGGYPVIHIDKYTVRNKGFVSIVVNILMALIKKIHI